MKRLLQLKISKYVAGLVLGISFFSLTDPRKLPPFMLMVAFIFIYGACLVICELAFRLLSLLKNGEMTGADKHSGWLYAAAALPTLLLVLQSVGQLTVRDLLTMVAIFGILYFYLVRFRKAT
jgi:hypothetical protein